MESDLTAFRIEQFKHLSEEKKAIDRYLWQIPLAALAVAALLLNLGRELLDESFALLMGSAGIVTVYAAFMLGRLHLRRDIRERRLLEVEESIETLCGYSGPPLRGTILPADVVQELRSTWSPKSRWLGGVSASTLGIVLLLLVSLLFFAAGFSVITRL